MVKSAESVESANKRAKVVTSDASQVPFNFENLPEVVLLNITRYLYDTSKGLLAVALTASSSSWRKSNWKIEPSQAAKIILAGQSYFDRVDFYEIYPKDEKEKVDIAAKLLDEDIGGFISLVNQVYGGAKSINLLHCYKVVGYGLQPLRDITDKLESACLVLNHKDDTIQSALSVEAVIPILEHIIEKREAPLGFTLPKAWCKEERRNQLLVRFLQKYNTLMNSQNVICGAKDDSIDDDGPGCTNICLGTQERPWVNFSGDQFGSHNLTCHVCDETICGDCKDECTNPCVKCKETGCKKCEVTMKCDTCQEYSHKECTYIDTCESCNKTTCPDCSQVLRCEDCDKNRCDSCVPFFWCEHPDCFQCNCDECGDESYLEQGYVRYCPDCESIYCTEHLMHRRIEIGEDEFDPCSLCDERSCSTLLEYNNKFNAWLSDMENKYSGGSQNTRRGSAPVTFSEHMKERSSLLQRCAAIGNKLPFKQKQFEDFDYHAKRHQSFW